MKRRAKACPLGGRPGALRVTVEFTPRNERPCLICGLKSVWEVWHRRRWRKPICLSCIWDIHGAECDRQERERARWGRR